MLYQAAVLLGALIASVQAQNCAPGWLPHNQKCWYFSDQELGGHEVGMTWTEAESWCQQNNAHLASFATVEERDWVYDNYLVNWDDTRWWIGLSDTTNENTFEWSDGTQLDPTVARWKPGEPSNSGKEDCVEMWIDKPFYTGQWNDNQCSTVNPFICKGDYGSFQTGCPVEWGKLGDSCYKIMNTEAQWQAAEVDCKAQGSVLASVTSAQQQSDLQGLISSQNVDMWLGYSDQVEPGVLQWSNPAAQGSSYSNWASGQPTSPLPYVGSTCVAMAAGLSYKWSTFKCSLEKKYICQRGLNGKCPYGWNLLAGKCYEFIINSNRLQTWTTASETCQKQGAKLLRIESDDEEKYVGTVLQQFLNLGFQEIWLGGSDIGHDDTFKWADGTAINKYYWDGNMPQSVKGTEDCLNLYTGKSAGNWETSSCFYQRPFICELPEGATIPSIPVVTVEGKCDSGWRHFRGSCYLVAQKETTQSESNSYCKQNGAKLASILDADELSFLLGSIQGTSWIGLTKQGASYVWMDGSPYSFTNFASASSESQQCVYMKASDGYWMDAACTEAHTAVCKKAEIPTPISTISPPTGNPGDSDKCGVGGWFSDPSSTQCYFINALQLRSWRDARFACQSIGGDLASINTPAEQTFLHAATGPLATVSNLWIGATDPNNFPHDILDVSDGGWTWCDETPFNYINWNDGEPNNSGDEDCGELQTDTGRWNDLECLNYRHFICEKTGDNANVIGPDVQDPNCQSNEACCFKHIGVEYGGALDDSALTASTEADEFFVASRGRLNTPADVIIFNDDISVGTGHGAWEPRGDDPEPWLQVDFDTHMEIKGIVTQGRNGLIQYSERQWTTSYKIKYSQDQHHTGSAVSEWEWLSDQDGNPIIFDGNSDQNTQVTNLFPRPIIAIHVRCYPVTWKDRGALRLEYVGCRASCLFKIGMNSGYIPDNSITASSSAGSKTPQQARAPVDKAECLASSSDQGADYRGWLSKTKDGIVCQKWNDQYPQSHDRTPQNYPDSGLESNFCRNPDGEDRPWCYTTDSNVRWDFCDTPMCPSYQPSGWSPSTSRDTEYVQVQFKDFFKVSGVTLYGSTSTYVSRYALLFSDDGKSYSIYKSQNGQDHLFLGLDGVDTEYTDILREPISTKYLRIQPRQWQGPSIVLQFEINGCYVDNRIACDTLGTDFTETSFSINCPAGCVEDLSAGLVYGTTVYTENSAMCPAAIHAGRTTDQHGGSVNVVKTSGEASYQGSYANGITSLDASASHLSLTFDGSVYRCDTDWQPWKDHCYYLSPKTVFKNWHDARAECISMGADLTSIHSSGENDFHEYMITQGDRGGDVWVGMNDLRTQNYYQWSDDTTVTWTKWDAKEPNGGSERCVEIYRLFGTWNDKQCESELSYICKKEKQMLPPLSDDEIPTDPGCDPGWKAFGSSCYLASSDEYIFIYGNRICEESGAKLVTIQDDQEQAFVHALVTSTLPSGLGYTAWIGLSAKTTEKGELYYTWEDGEIVSYTHWDQNEPDVRFSCAIPFTYKGNTYYECITIDHPARLEDTPWCSIDPVYRGRWINCDTGYEYGCTYMDDQTGFWQVDICGENRYYVCEKDRDGYSQVINTTPNTSGTCADGWASDATTSYCYQINEFTDDNRASRLGWSQAVDYCRAQGADLVSIHSADENDAVIRFVTKQAVYSYTYFWLGLNNLDSSAGYVWTDGSPVDYTNWNVGEPNNNQGLENCAEGQLYDSLSGWNDLSCDSLRNYICKIPKGVDPKPKPTIPPPIGSENDPACGHDDMGTWVRYQPSYGADKCYMFITQPVYGWQYAENTCITLGGHLVAVHSSDENRFVVGRNNYAGAGTVWIGLRDVGGRSFYWADGGYLDYVNWASGEPNNYYDSEGCATLNSDGGTWNDDNCGRLFPFVCEKMIGATGGTIPPTQQATGNCPTGFKDYGNACYITGGDKKVTWETAMEWCHNNSAELTVITNQYEQAFMNDFLFGYGEVFWIGLSDRFTNNNDQFVWIDQTEVSYTNWAPGQPSGTSEGCAGVNVAEGGFWEDYDCQSVNPFVCYTSKSDSLPPPPNTESPIGCPEGYSSSGHEQACYKLVDQPMSWNDAQKYCRAEGSRIDLVSINEVYDNDLIKKWFWHDVTSGNSLWIGLTFTETIDDSSATKYTFSWADGWPVTYTNWAPNEPSTDISGNGCVMMDTNGAWAAVAQTGSGTTCATTMPFVCKQSFGPIPTTPEPPTGTCDPSFIGIGANCYYFEFGNTDSTTRSWYEAAYMCEERGAVLASIHSDDEIKDLVGITSTVTSHNLFIGLSSNGFGGWAWKDETPADYFNWGAYEPNGQSGEECVEFYPWDGTWNDVDCFEARGFICKTPRGNTQCDVPTNQRADCGIGVEDIDKNYCVSRRGCCWDEEYKSENISGCFYPEGTVVGPSGIPINPTETVSSTELSGGAVAGIIIGLLILLVLVGGGVYCYCFSSTKSLPSLSMPSMPASWSSSSTSKKENTASGFDNPMALDNDGNLHSVA